MANLVLLATGGFFWLAYNRSVKGEMPCSAAPSQASVIDICLSGTVQEDVKYLNILLRSTDKMHCQCKLSIKNQESSSTTVIFRKYNDSVSSSPGYYGCGLILNFGTIKNSFWSAQCIFTSISYSVPTNEEVFIKSEAVNGTLASGKGYCIEIIKQNNSDPSTLQLSCGSPTYYSVTTKTVTPLLIEESKTSRPMTETEMSLNTTTGNQSLTILNAEMSQGTSGTEVTTYTTKAALSLPTNVTKTSDASIILFVSIGGVVTCLLIILVVILILFRKRLKRKREGEENLNETNDQIEYALSDNELDYNELYLASIQSGNHTGNDNESTPPLEHVESYGDYVTIVKDDGLQNELTSV